MAELLFDWFDFRRFDYIEIKKGLLVSFNLNL